MLKHKYSLAFALITFAFVVSRNSTAQVGTDWTAMKDRTSSCQISVPRNWGQPVTLLKGRGRVRTFSPETQKMVAERMLENTEKRVFYILKSTPTPSAQPSTTYQVSVPETGSTAPRNSSCSQAIRKTK